MNRAPLSARAGRALLATSIAALALAALAANASAVILHIGAKHTVSYQPLRHHASRFAAPFDAAFANLEYNGGPVMASNTNYAVYWMPAGSPKYPSDYQPGIATYFEDLAAASGSSTNTDSVAAQYNDAAGQFAAYSSSYGGALIDTNPYPPNGCTKATICLTDAQLRAELQKLVGERKLPADVAHEYFMLTPPGVESCFRPGGECSAGTTAPVYCAYHSDIPLKGGGVIIYADQPYVTGNAGCDDGNHPNGKSSDGALEGGLSHEHVESVTDPEPNSAWADWTEGGSEIGDKCRTFLESSEYGTPLGTAKNGARYNQLINGHEYWYQQEWSNRGNECLQRLALPAELPTASYAAKSESETTVSFDAGASTAPGGVAHYDWQWNDGPGPVVPTETTSPTISHTFAAPGVYDVALTVYAADGTSSGTAKKLIVGTLPAPSVAKVTPPRGPAAGGATVKITGLHLNEASAVSFGGTPAAFVVTSGTTIEAIAPEHPAGVVDVRVTTPGGTSPIASTDHYAYIPVVSSLSPSEGPVAGGTVVTVAGSGFALGSSATTFRFGASKALSVECSSTTSCQVTAPKHAAGAVEVFATVASEKSLKAPPGSTYTYH